MFNKDVLTFAGHQRNSRSDMDKERKRYSQYLDSRAKRAVDLLAGMVLLVPVSILVMVLGIVMWLVDGRPIFFKQKRAGKNGRTFCMAKIRTLKVSVHPNMPACQYDTEPYLTRTGRIYRKYRLDELPQLISVLKGEMSLVGPRPELLAIVMHYQEKHRRRLLCRPGITGLWQINATRNRPIHKDIKFDLYYLKNASFCMDLKIIFSTLIFVLSQKSEK